MRLLVLSLLLASTLSAQSAAVLAALATGTYFPLDVGDRWVYREDTRLGTATYQAWRVDRTELVNGYTYSVIAIEGSGDFYGEQWYRADAAGRVYLLSYSGDVLFLDPTLHAPNAGQVQLLGPGGTAVTAAGTFPDTVNYTNPMGLAVENGTLARGLGLLTSTTDLETGFSGGLLLKRTLVEAEVAGGIHFPAAGASLALGIESLQLNVSGMQVTNCAVPCYFAACYITPGADPSGTYKPCARARVELRNWPADASRSVTLELLTLAGASAFSQSLTLDSAPAAVLYLQVPLYSAPNQPLAPGAYQLAARSSDGAAQASLTVHIQ